MNIYGIPEFPFSSTKEEYQNLVKLYIDAGAIAKKDLVPGAWYLGQSRSTNVAQYWPQGGFHYIRYKLGDTFVDNINHFEDDNGYDLFIPFKLIVK